jgi:hypothetical protein
MAQAAIAFSSAFLPGGFIDKLSPMFEVATAIVHIAYTTAEKPDRQ